MELDDLFKNVKDFFTAAYPSKPGTNTFLSFEPLGHMISKEDFKDMTGNFNPDVANEELSRICDKIPEVGEIFRSSGLNTVSGIYGELISSLAFAEKNITAADKAPYLSKFGRMKSLAEQRYQPLASVATGGMGNYYLTRGTPASWYDAGSNIWTSKTITATTGTPPPKTPVQQPVFTKKLAKAAFLWKQNAPGAKLQTNAQLAKVVNNATLVNKVNLVNQNLVAAGRFATTALKKGASLKRGGTAESAVVAAPIMRMGKIQTVNRQLYTALNLALPFSNKILINRECGDVKNIETKEIKSDNFSMTFGFTLVQLDRPWMVPEVFQSASLWYALTRKSGYYSTGEFSDTNNGIFCAVPKAMIVIKDLKLSAHWSEADKKALEKSIGFGSINISGGSFDAGKNQLLAPGIQIIAWVCEVLPKMPMFDDMGI